MNIEKQCPIKKISPYRVYKRETAALIKQEFPGMSNEERAQIVRERWRCIADSLKAIYVCLARFEQEVDHQQKVQEFYKERVETAKKHCVLMREKLDVREMMETQINAEVQTSGKKRLQCFEALTTSSDDAPAQARLDKTSSDVGTVSTTILVSNE